MFTQLGSRILVFMFPKQKQRPEAWLVHLPPKRAAIKGEEAKTSRTPCDVCFALNRGFMSITTPLSTLVYFLEMERTYTKFIFQAGLSCHEGSGRSHGSAREKPWVDAVIRLGIAEVSPLSMRFFHQNLWNRQALSKRFTKRGVKFDY